MLPCSTSFFRPSDCQCNDADCGVLWPAGVYENSWDPKILSVPADSRSVHCRGLCQHKPDVQCVRDADLWVYCGYPDQNRIPDYAHNYQLHFRDFDRRKTAAWIDVYQWKYLWIFQESDCRCFSFSQAFCSRSTGIRMRKRLCESVSVS